MRARRAVVAGTLLGSVVLGVVPMPIAGASAPPPYVVGIGVGGDDGRGRLQVPGLSCADGGQGAYWHTEHHAPLPAGTFGTLPGEAHLLLELHSDVIRRPNSVSLPPPGPPVDPPTAFLPPGESEAVLANQRGTIRIGFGAGSCELPAVRFDGRTASGEAPWAYVAGSGAYETVSGQGSVAFTVDVDPGADNPWSVALDGELTVDQPQITTTVERVFWGSLGLDYLTRRVSVRYRITNAGPGPAFAVVLSGTTSTTNGVLPLGPHGVALPDLARGGSTTVTVRYQLGLLAPCGLVILRCNLATSVTVTRNDALDRGGADVSAALPVEAPDLPPLLP